MHTFNPAPDILCFSHLRWSFVFQRPQQLMTRFARCHRVFFLEEPTLHDGPSYLTCDRTADHVTVLVPKLSRKLAGDERAIARAQAQMLHQFVTDFELHRVVAWYYTPMALAF